MEAPHKNVFTYTHAGPFTISNLLAAIKDRQSEQRTPLTGVYISPTDFAQLVQRLHNMGVFRPNHDKPNSKTLLFHGLEIVPQPYLEWLNQQKNEKATHGPQN